MKNGMLGPNLILFSPAVRVRDNFGKGSLRLLKLKIVEVIDALHDVQVGLTFVEFVGFDLFGSYEARKRA
jgi:hypothetical protein